MEPKSKPAKRKIGRPTTIPAKVEANLVRRVVEGKTVKEVCRALRLSYATVMNRRVLDADFRERLARATVLGAEASLDEAEDRLRKATNKTIMREREIALHMRWKASKLLPHYRDRTGEALRPLNDEPIDTFALVRQVALLVDLDSSELQRRAETAERRADLAEAQLARLAAALRPALPMAQGVEGLATHDTIAPAESKAKAEVRDPAPPATKLTDWPQPDEIPDYFRCLRRPMVIR